MSDDTQQQVGFPKRWKSKLPIGWDSTADSMDNEEVKDNLIKFQKVIAHTEKEMENDIKLNDAKELVKEYAGEYKEIINEHRAMIKYLLYIMEGRGI